MTKRTLSARGLAQSNPDLTATYRRALAEALQDMALGQGRASDLAIGLRAALRRCKDVLGTEMCALMRPIEPGDMVTALAAEDDPLMALPPGTDGRVLLIEPVEAAGTRPLMLVVLRAGAFTVQEVLFHKALAQAIRDRLDRDRAPVQDMAALPESQALSNFYWQIIELTNALLGHQGPDLDSHIHSVLARIGQLVEVERICVYRLHPADKIRSTHEWTVQGVPLSRQISQHLPRAVLDPWKDQLQAPQTVVIEDVDTRAKAGRTRRLMQVQGVKASVAVPMRRNERLDGYVGFYCTLRSRAFTPDELHLLQTVANAIAVVLHRHDAEKEAALALAQLEAKSDLQSAMLAAVPDLVLELDKRGRCLACTIGVGQQHLVQLEPCIGRKIEELLPAHLGQRFRETMKVVRADGVRRSFDYDQQIGGETCSCNASIAPRNQTEPQDGWFVILRDITTSRVQQRRIAQLSKIAELTSHMVIVTDADANIEWVNPAFEARTGWRLDEIRGRRPESFLRSRRAGRVASARVEYALRSGSLSQTEILNHNRAGVEYWVSMDVQPMLDDTGAVQGFVSVQTDITELKRKHSDEMYDWKMAIEGASDGVAMLNAEGYFLFMNHAFRDHFGIPDAEAVKPLHWRDFYPMETADWFATQPWRQSVVGHALRVELRGTHRDGRPVRQELSLNTRANGGLLIIARDISDRARAEAEKARLRDQLQLAQQREMISHVAAGVAHDLHNIFAVVSGTASLLEPSLVGNDEALSGIRRIKRAAQMAIDLGAGLATLGRNDARPKPQDLRDLVQQGIDLLGTARIEQHGIVPKLPDSVQTVWADSTKLLQVIVNLALNACEADPDRLTAVRVELLEQTDWHPGRPPDSGIWSAGRRYRAFQVADNGPGVAPKDRERLFEPYFSTKGKAGTGLGLAIVAGILQQSDAAIWFDSQPGQGTTVTVAWPASAPEPALLPRPLTLMEHGVAPPGTGALVGRTILVVDDAADVADVLAEMLDSVGAQTLALSDPEEAQALLAANPGLWSALVTDLSMPEKSGVDLARAAAALDPPVPCILVSSHIGFKEVPSGLFAAILLKPTEASVLISAVEQALAIRSKLS